MELLIIAVVVLLVFRGLSRAADRVDGAQPVGWVPDTKWSVVAPLSRTDLRLLLRHPAFVAGVLVTPLMLFAATESVSSWRYASAGIAGGLVPFGWLTIIAVNLVTLRPRRTGTEELFAVLPAPQSVRTSAMLSTALGPVVVAAILAAGWVLVVGSRDEVRGSPEWAEIAAGVLIVAGSVCVGVAVARWLPNAGFGVLAVVATIVIQARFLDVSTWPWNRSQGDQLRFVAFLASPTRVTDDFLELRPSGWHLVYLGAHRELNYIRHAYNERLRGFYGGREPFFDLAHRQSLGPDGRIVTVPHRRSRVPILARAWTSDGGHLNEEGRRRVAAGFLVALALCSRSPC